MKRNFVQKVYRHAIQLLFSSNMEARLFLGKRASASPSYDNIMSPFFMIGLSFFAQRLDDMPV